MDASPNRTPEREAFYREISPHNLAPLWDVLHTVVTKEPASPAKPAIWRYDAEVRDLPHAHRHAHHRQGSGSAGC